LTGREADGRVLVGAGAPDFAVGHEVAPDLAAVDGRAVVADDLTSVRPTVCSIFAADDGTGVFRTGAP
jgi:hypothetical protein